MTVTSKFEIGKLKINRVSVASVLSHITHLKTNTNWQLKTSWQI